MQITDYGTWYVITCIYVSQAPGFRPNAMEVFTHHSKTFIDKENTIKLFTKDILDAHIELVTIGVLKNSTLLDISYITNYIANRIKLYDYT